MYHVLNRAIGRAQIFDKSADYAAFEKVLRQAWERSGMRLLAYTILPKRTVWTPRSARSARVHQATGVRRRPYQLRMRWRIRATTPQRRSAIH